MIEFHIIDRIDGLIARSGRSGELISLRYAAETLVDRLRSLDERLFRRVRSGILAGGYRGKALESLLQSYAGADSAEESYDLVGYDVLDRFIGGLLLAEAAPIVAGARGPEMVGYQPTPARVVRALVARAGLSARDVFYDLGAGLGQVAILAHLLSGAPAKGVEVEPAYCAYARRRAAALGLAQVAFIEADARDADYSDGTVFFMYTPFRGRLLAAVLGRLHAEAAGRPIRLITYGPCTAIVAREGWLTPAGPAGRAGLGIFSSLAT